MRLALNLEALLSSVYDADASPVLSLILITLLDGSLLAYFAAVAESLEIKQDFSTFNFPPATGHR
jgi:hypothetical protein